MAESVLSALVATTWIAGAVAVVAFVGGAGTLITSDRRLDWLSEAATEVGMVLAAAVLALGATFATLEWNTWWAWDPRQVTAAVMLLMFGGVQLLRATLRDPDQRLPRAATATVLACIDLPVVHECVQWWQAVHAFPIEVTTGATLPSGALRTAGLGALVLTLVVAGALAWRWSAARSRGLREAPERLPPRS